MAEEHPTLKVIVEDGTEIELETKYARVSTLIAGVWDDQDDKSEPVAIPNVSKAILE